MLGKTYVKTIFREIRGTLGRFVAIFAIVALGVGFLAGLLATTPDMKISVDRYFDRTNMMDIFIKAPMGLTEGDAEALRNLPEVDLVLPAYVTDALVKTSADEALATRIYGLPLERIHEKGFVNRMELLQGRMPERNQECLVQQGGGYLSSIAIGTVLTITDESLDYGGFETLDKVYGVTQYTVTGIVKSPLYISTEREPSSIGSGRLGTVIYVREACYALPAYTDFYITLQNAASLRGFTKPYQERINKAVIAVETLGIERSKIRREEMLVEAGGLTETTLAQVETEYLEAKNTAERELAAARLRLEQSAAEIAAGEAELVEAEVKLAEGRGIFEEKQRQLDRELQDNEALLKSGEAELAAAKQTLREHKSQLDAARSQVEKHRGKWYLIFSSKAREGIIQYDEGLEAYTAGLKIITEKERELQRGRSAFEAGRQKAETEFAATERELDAVQAEIRDGRARLAEARRKLADGEAAYTERLLETVARLMDGSEQLEQAKQSLTDTIIPMPQWYVLDRNANVGCMNYKANAEKIADVAKVFPIFFLFIAALVALTTMTRMVEEERIQIGILKALGYQKRTILCKYLIYCGLTGVLGSAVGMISGFQGLPIIIYRAFATMYHLPPLVTEFNWPFGLMACGLVLTCTMGATVYACYRSLWEKPALLMVPRSPKSGKRIFLEYIPFIWNRMKFTHKVTARNLIRQKKHFVMTITGIAGCTALMVAAFGLRDSMTDIARTQFEEILQYDVQIELRNEISARTFGANRRFLRSWTSIHSESGYIVKGNERFNIGIIVPKTAETLPNFINLRNRLTKRPQLFSDTQVILTEKIAERLGLNIGDTIMLENAKGLRGSFTLSGITENYVGVTVYLGHRSYTKEFGGNLSYRTLFAYTGIREQAAQDRFIAGILAEDSVMAAEFTAQIQTSYNNLLHSIGFVVLVLIFAAGGLAMIVLYNLTNININERTREIATLRVLGFHRSEAAAYIFREITVLSIFGALAGLCLGIPLHSFIIGVAENPDLMFGRRIAPVSFILSGVITLFFSAIVDLFMLKKLRAVKMAESMKAVD